MLGYKGREENGEGRKMGKEGRWGKEEDKGKQKEQVKRCKNGGRERKGDGGEESDLYNRGECQKIEDVGMSR